MTIHTPRDIEFTKRFLECGMDETKAIQIAEDVGYKPGLQAINHAGRLKKVAYRNERMQRELKKAGVDHKRVAEKMNGLLDAESAMFPGKPDNIVQLKALELSAKIMDVFPPARVEMDKHETHEVVIDKEVFGLIEKYDRMRNGAITVEAETITDPQGS
jgi:hypothetical protein